MSSPPQREHDEGDEIVRVVEAVGRADGDLDPVVGRLEPGVGAAQLDGPEDVRPTTADLPGWRAALVQLHDLPFERLVVVAGDVSGRLSSASNLMSFVPHRTV